MLIDPPGFLSSDPERISEHFSRCGPGRSYACVIDGDTFKLGQRKVRIIGIDAPETHPANCPEEARLGERQTAEIAGPPQPGIFRARRSGLRQAGPLWPRPPLGAANPAGRGMQLIADDMRASGLAHRYLGGYKPGWC